MITAYFDASGKLSDPKIKWLLMVGLVTTAHKWTKFERDWQVALDDEGITEFHATEFYGGFGEFESWHGQESRRNRFAERLGRIIKKWTMFSVSRGSDLEAFRAIDADYEYHEKAAYPYAQCGMTAISGIRRELRRRRIDDPVLYVFEKGDDHQDQLLDRLRTDLRPPLDVDPMFLEKRYQHHGKIVHRLPFQACDFMAWEHGKAFKNWSADKSAPLRKPLEWMYGNLRGDWTYQKLESYRMVVRDLRIPRRTSAR